MSIPFTRVLRGELKKTKNIYGLLISLASPAVVIIGFTFYLFTELGSKPEDPAIWRMYGRYIFQFFFFLYPLYAALMAFMLVNIEHKNKGFKHLFTLPVPKWYFYISKVLILLMWITASFVVAWVLMISCGKLLGAVFPNSGFQLAPPTNLFFAFYFKLYIVLLGIVAIHYFLSLYFDNFIISVGSACFLVIAGMIIQRWEYSFLFPYSHPLFVQIDYLNNVSTLFNRNLMINMAYAITFFVGGYILMSRKAIK